MDLKNSSIKGEQLYNQMKTILFIFVLFWWCEWKRCN